LKISQIRGNSFSEVYSSKNILY